MSTQVAGVLKDPFERPLANTDIDIRAITNTFAVLPGATIKVTTNSQGEYNFILEPANYAVSVILDGRAVYQGVMSITSSTPPGTLPQLLKQAEMLSELPLNYGEYFQQVQASVKDDADRAQAAADSVGNELDLAEKAAQQAMQSASSANQSKVDAQIAYQNTKQISDKFTNLDEAVAQTQQNADQTQSDAQNTAADRQAAESAAQRAEDAAESAETVNERNIRVPQGETINALPGAASRASTVSVFDSAGQSDVKPLSGFALLDGNGKIPISNIPAAAITEVFPVSSQAAMLALAADPGDVAKRTDLGRSFILMASPASNLANWIILTDDILSQLSSSDADKGDALIAVMQPFPGAVKRTQHQKNLDRISVSDFGALFDGSAHPLSEFYSTLADAQVKYPFATALTDPIDWAATQAAANAVMSKPNGGQILFPSGIGVFGTKTVSMTLPAICGVSFSGEGQDITQIKYSGTAAAIDVTYVASGWWINASSSNSVFFEKMTFCTDKVNSGSAIRINGGALSGRPIRATCFDRVNFRGFNGLDQSFAKALDFINLAYVFWNSCNWYQALTGLTGIGVYARAVQADGTNSQVCGGYYFNQCQCIYGDAWIDLNAYTEGVYLTNCITDGGIGYSVRWPSATAESGLQVIGGQYSSSVCSFRIGNIIHGCITGADIRGVKNNWRGIWLSRSSGFVVSGCNVIGENNSTGLMGVYIEDNNFGEAFKNNFSGNTFQAMDYGFFMESNSKRNFIADSNVYASVTIPVNDVTAGNNVVIKKQYRFAVNVTLVGGAATESATIQLPVGLLSAKPECVFAKGSDNDLIGTYLFNSAGSTSTAVVVSFRLSTLATIPAGTYRVMVEVS